jgi:hypothetical protein
MGRRKRKEVFMCMMFKKINSFSTFRMEIFHLKFGFYLLLKTQKLWQQHSCLATVSCSWSGTSPGWDLHPMST